MKRALLFFPLVLVAGSQRAQAAQDTAACTGFITSLPAVISSQGTWCMDGDLATSADSGAAITIAANNVVLDCNDFKLGGLSAGLGTGTYGVSVSDRLNITIRRCNIRGFQIGVNMYSSGSVIEDSRISGSTQRGIYLQGDNNTIRRNFITSTGGTTSGYPWAMGISAFGDVDVYDNTVDGVVSSAGGNERSWGIFVNDATGIPADINVSGNLVRGVVADGSGEPAGIATYSPGDLAIRDNIIFGPTAGVGIYCLNADAGAVSGNVVVAANIANYNCGNDGGNDFKP